MSTRDCVISSSQVQNLWVGSVGKETHNALNSLNISISFNLKNTMDWVLWGIGGHTQARRLGPASLAQAQGLMGKSTCC